MCTDTGADARLFVPRDTLNLRYQSRVQGSDDSNGHPIAERGYATLNLLAGLHLTEHLEASVNVRKVTNVISQFAGMGRVFCAAPRGAIGTLRFIY